MKWLAVILVLDLAVLGALFVRGPVQEKAEFSFVHGAEHHFLDPQRVSWRHDFRIVELLFDPLVKMKLPEMEIEPGVAERWEVADDQLTYTFHLRPDARWSNGDAVTAGDFLYGWRRALLPDLAADYVQLLFLIDGGEAFFNWRTAQLDAYAKRPSAERSADAAAALWREAEAKFDELVAAKATDDRTIVVRLVSPTSYFLELLTQPVFMPVHAGSVHPQAAFAADTGMLVQDPYWTGPDRLVCNGPYVLKERRFKRDLLLTANPMYYDRAKVGPKSIREQIVADVNLQLLMYEAGDTDYLCEIPSAQPISAELAAQNRPDAHLIETNGTYFYSFNCLPTLPNGAKNPLHDARVRRALSMGIDRATITRNVTRLNQPVALTFIPPGILPGYDPPVESGASFDPAAAKALLAEAGYDDPSKLTGLSILYNTGQGHDLIAQAIKNMWQEHLGVHVSLEGVESKVFGKRLKSQDCTIARASWFGDYRDPTTYLDKYRAGNGNNDAKWVSTEYEGLLDRAATERDPRLRMELFRQAETILMHEQPIAPIYQYAEVHLFDAKKIQGMNLNAWMFRRFDLLRIVNQQQKRD